MLPPSSRIDIAVEDNSRFIIESGDYKYIGIEIIRARELTLQVTLTIKVFVYNISMERLLRLTVPEGFWIRMTNPPMWKRVDTGVGKDAPN